MHTSHFVMLVGVATIGCLAGCGINVETQPQRLDFLKDKTAESIKKITQCEDTKLTFKESKRIATTWYDVYSLEGCGQKTDYTTAVTQSGQWVQFQFGVAPQPDELRMAAKEQLAKTAEFDLDCKSDLDFTMLSEVFDPMHTSLIASIGVRGCEKKSTYRTTCVDTNYKNGHHDIVCTSVVTSVPTQ